MADKTITGTAVSSPTSASFITGIRARGIASTELDDTAMEAIIDEALTEYSRYRPLIVDLTFDTVADQQIYTWTAMGDANGMNAMLVIWNPYQTGDERDLARTLAILGVPREAGYWHLPSQDMLEQIKASAWATNYGGKGYQIDPDGGDLYLTPVPEQAGDSVYVLYTKKLSSVADVKTVDRDIFLDLLESLASFRLVNEIAKKSTAVRIKTPEYERAVGEQIGAWRKNGKEMRAQFISKIQAGRAAAARS